MSCCLVTITQVSRTANTLFLRDQHTENVDAFTESALNLRKRRSENFTHDVQSSEHEASPSFYVVFNTG